MEQHVWTFINAVEKVGDFLLKNSLYFPHFDHLAYEYWTFDTEHIKCWTELWTVIYRILQLGSQGDKFFETKCYLEFTGSQPPKSCGFNPETGLDQVCCTKEGKSELKLSPRKFGWVLSFNYSGNLITKLVIVKFLDDYYSFLVM